MAVASSDFNDPSIDPANNDSLAGCLRFTFMKMMQNINTRLPAQVISYDRPNNRVQVQIMIAMVSTNGTTVSRSQIASVPVKRYGGGGYFISFPLVAGDLGWIEANDRDISTFLTTFEESAPGSSRMFDFSDSVFFPDEMKAVTNPADVNNAVLSSLDGTVKISLTAAGVIITAPLVSVVGVLDATDGFTVSGDSTPGVRTININGNVIVTGDLAVTGMITAGTSITPDTPPPPP